MQTKEMSFFESIFFLLVFVSPHTICSITPLEHHGLIQLLATLGYLLTFLAHPQLIYKVFSGTSARIIVLYTIFSIIRLVVYHSFSFYSVLMPIAAFTGYYYISEYRIKLKVFDLYLMFLYVFFVITYYSHLPSLFFRGHFDDGSWFGGASSNAIPIAIINTLYIYYVVAYLQNEVNDKKFLTLSFINFVFIFIQQSRIGILVSALCFVFCYIKYLNRFNVVVRYVPIILISIVLVFYAGSFFVSYFDEQIGELSFNAYEEDVRNMVVNYFFDHMDTEEFLFGYPPGTEFANNINYTYNVWLEHWNKYTIFGVVLIIWIFFKRITNRKNYLYPLYFFVPFLIYGYVEPRYLPNYWDFFLYLLLFVRKYE